MRKNMKKFTSLLLMLSLCVSMALAQNPLNNKADNILGDYQGVQNGEPFKTHITKLSNGTYKCQIYWVKNATDKNGKTRLDENNPDKSLRSVRCDQIVLFKGLKYDAKNKEWSGCKIYDPQRGINANCTIVFDKDGRLKVSGKILGIGETVYWKKL